MRPISHRSRSSPPGAAAPFTGGAPVFDAHCHVFNLEYLLLEIAQILWDMIRGEYPLPPDHVIEDTIAIRSDFEVRDPLDAAEHFLAWIMEIGFAAIGSETAHVRDLRRNASRVWRVDGINLIALMMDIYFMFAPPLGAQEAGDPPLAERRQPARDSGASDRDRRVQAFRKRIARALRRRHESYAAASDAARRVTGPVEHLLEVVVGRVLGRRARPPV